MTSQGAFVWADSTTAPFASTAKNQFLVRASGGITLYTNSFATVGATLAAGSGSWSTLSDRDPKTNVVAVDPAIVLAGVVALPISTWNYISQEPAIRHMGPMAQDFAAAFGLGENATTISTVDAQGVALAAIQGIYGQNQTQAQQLDAQQQLIAAQQQLLAEQEARLTALEQRVAALEAEK